MKALAFRDHLLRNGRKKEKKKRKETDGGDLIKHSSLRTVQVVSKNSTYFENS